MRELNGCLEGPREETSKEFRNFSEAQEVHTWPDAWIGFNDLRKTRTRKRQCQMFFRNPNANLPKVTGRPPHETVARRSYAAMEETAILCISGKLDEIGWFSRDASAQK